MFWTILRWGGSGIVLVLALATLVLAPDADSSIESGTAINKQFNFQ